MCHRGIFDSLTLSLALDEPLPDAAGIMPSTAPHLVSRFWVTHHGQRVKTTIDPFLQKQVMDIINNHQKILENNLIYNAAAIVVSVDDGRVLAYCWVTAPCLTAPGTIAVMSILSVLCAVPAVL